MKRKDIVNLIRCHKEGDEEGFDRQANLIADEFYSSGDKELANYITSLVSSNFTIIPQESETKHIGVLEKVGYSKKPLFIPDVLKDNLVGVVNAVRREIGINCFLFYGAPGTGKTEAASQVARLLKRNLWKVNIAQLIDSHLGETSKNIANLFESISNYKFKSTMVVLFDEIDSLALKRDDARDLREMARATTELFKGLDGLSDKVMVIATTNMYKSLDRALVRRFHAHIDFDVYSKDDLVDIGTKLFNVYSKKVEGIEQNSKLVSKILNSANSLPSPGELKNIIKMSIAFSNLDSPCDYIKRLFSYIHPNFDLSDVSTLFSKYSFSTREIQFITGISKSEVARRIKDGQE